MKLALLLNCYNGSNELERLIQSLLPNFFDVLIAIDGIYKFTKEKNPELLELSTDETRQLIITQKKVPEVYLHDMPNVTEFEKRNKYLELCDLFNIDVGVIVDTDEFIIMPEGTKPEDAFNRFRQNLETTLNKSQNREHNVFGIRTFNVHDNMESYKPRIWYKPGEMRYINGSHYHYANVKTEQATIETFNKNRINYCQHCADLVKGIILAHDHSLRTDRQTEMHDQYTDYLKRFEGLVQSHKYGIEEAHKLAASGISYDDILRNKIDKK